MLPIAVLMARNAEQPFHIGKTWHPSTLYNIPAIIHSTNALIKQAALFCIVDSDATNTKFFLQAWVNTLSSNEVVVSTSPFLHLALVIIIFKFWRQNIVQMCL